MSGQSIVDRLNAAKHTVAGSALGRAVVKATTEEVMGPKRKHLEYLLQCTSEINVSIPQMADLLIERTQNTSWVVAYKSLITIHHLMCYGNERFSQYMASHNSKFILNNFVMTGAQGIDMSSYIRKYAHYLNEKRETYKLMGFDFCKVKRGKEDGMLRTMSAEKLLKTLPILQKQLDALVQFDIQANELTNGVINSCFVLLSKDLIRLFACYNDGIINLLEKFFDMNKKNCREALEIYKKFLERTENVSQFLKVAESSGMDKSDIPDLAKAPSSLLEALESHVNSMDNKKSTSNVTAAASNSAKPSAAVSNAINSLSSNTSMLSAEEKRRVLEEEAKTLEQFKNNHLKKQTSLSSPTNENLFSNGSSSNTTPTNGHHPVANASKAATNADDLFGLDLNNINPVSNGVSANHSQPSSANDDLLMLSGANPFLQSIVNQSYSTTTNNINPFQANMFQQAPPAYQATFPPTNSMFPVNNNQNKLAFKKSLQLDDLFSGLNFTSSTTTASTNVTASESDTFNPFNDTDQVVANYETASTATSYDANQTINKASNDDISNINSSTTNPTNTNLIGIDFSEFDAFGDVLKPSTNSVLNPISNNTNLLNNKPSNGADNKNGEQKILSTDLDSTLASLADNLDINYKNKNFQKNHQWNTNAPQASQIKTGGQNWNAKTPLGAPAVPAANAPMTTPWSAPLTGGGTPAGTPPAWSANPFAAMGGVMQPQPMGMQPKMSPMNPIAANKPAVQSSNPFDLF